MEIVRGNEVNFRKLFLVSDLNEYLEKIWSLQKQREYMEHVLTAHKNDLESDR